VDAALQARRRRASDATSESDHRDSAAAMSADGYADRLVSPARSRSLPGAVDPSVLAEQVSAGMLRRASSAAP
jgi:hypothetical protein